MRLLTIVLSAACLWTALPATASDEIGIARDIRPLERYQEVIERPLFSPSRRAAAGAEAGPVEAPDAPILQGVVLARNTRIALLAYGTPSTARRVTEGQDLGPWKIEKILKDQVIIRTSDGKAATVRLKTAGSHQAANTGPQR